MVWLTSAKLNRWLGFSITWRNTENVVWGSGHYGQKRKPCLPKLSPYLAWWEGPQHLRFPRISSHLHLQVGIWGLFAHPLFAALCRVHGRVSPARGAMCAGLSLSLLRWGQALLPLPHRLQGLRRARPWWLHRVCQRWFCPLQWHVFWRVSWRNLLWRSHWRLSRLAAVVFPTVVQRYKCVWLKTVPKGTTCAS